MAKRTTAMRNVEKESGLAGDRVVRRLAALMYIVEMHRLEHVPRTALELDAWAADLDEAAWLRDYQRVARRTIAALGAAPSSPRRVAAKLAEIRG